MAEFLETAIRSVVEQDYSSIEYIVVDGGTDAATPQVVERYGERIAAYVREPDHGQSDAINKGFQRAKGEILAWVNADDYYFPGAVSRAIRCFAAEPTLDIVYGDAVFVDREGQFLRYFTEVEAHDADRLRSYSDYISQPTTFFKRSALERVGFLDESLNFTMDWDLWCRLARAGCHFHYEHALLAANREYPETKTQAGGGKRLREIFQVNMRNKTKIVPWAALAFAHQELLHGKGAALARGADALLWPIRFAKRSLMGRRSITPLYGLYHRSTEAMAEVRISLPLFGMERNCAELTLGLPVGLERQTVAVEVNGKWVGEIDIDSSRPTQVLTFPIRGSAEPRLDVVLCAATRHQIDGREVCFHLRGFRICGPEPC